MKQTFFWLLLFCIPLSVGELTLRWLIKARAEVWTPASFSYDDAWVGSRPQPNLHLKVTAKQGGKTLYQATYSTDQWGRRITPLVNPLAKNGSLVFFGCSYTFGIGVNDDETFPAALSRRLPGYRSYNYGGSGYGPQEMLALLESPGFQAQVPQGKSIGLYTFIDDHVERALGSPRVFIYWGRHLPYYRLNAQGELERQGDFESGRPVLSRWYRLMSHSYLLTTAIGALYPNFVSDQDLVTVATLLDRSRKKYQELFQSDDFYVIFYPGARNFSPRLIPLLKERGVRYLDYSKKNLAKEDWLPDRNHPNARGHEKVASWVAGDLKILSRPSPWPAERR